MKYLQGKYIPINPKKYVGDVNNIVYRSSWERKLFVFLDNNPSILQWNSEECIIPYISPIDGKIHRYFVDCVVKYKKKDGREVTSLIEVKPFAQTKPPEKPKRQTKYYLDSVETYIKNVSKWKAAKQFAEEKGMEFMILTENELGIK